MKEIITGSEAKAADRYAIDVLGIPSLALMEKASSFVADHILGNYPDSKQTVTILIFFGEGRCRALCRKLYD